MSWLTALLLNPVAIVFFAVIVCTVFPTAIVYRHKTKKAEMDADLKMKMLEMGMSAADIERVLLAESSPDEPKNAANNRFAGMQR